MRVSVLFKLVDELLHRIADKQELGRIEHAPQRIFGRELETAEGDVVVISRERPRAQQQLGLILHLVGITCQHALVETLGRTERWPVAEKHIEEFQPIHMPAENDKTKREWRELLKTAQDDVERQWRVYSNRAAMLGRAATPDIAPHDTEDASDQTNLGGDEE